MNHPTSRKAVSFATWTKSRALLSCLAAAAILVAGVVIAGPTGKNVKGAAVGADVIVGDLYDTDRWGELGGITAYSVATTSCNTGDENLLWVADTASHPVIAQNMYRLKDGRMEQIGMSWVKHGFAALAESLCDSCQSPGTGSLLGVGCSDPYSAFLNGDQASFFGSGGLGPRSEINAATGVFPFPYGNEGAGDVIYKRLQVKNEDLDPAQNAGALYFVEGQYVTPDDAAAGNNANNASYRQVTVDPSFELSFADVTQRTRPAILAWADQDPAVTVAEIDIPSDGRMILAYKVTEGKGTWRYEYALHNLTSHRSARRFALPVDPQVAITNAGFHDVDYHSGEPFDGTDWAFVNNTQIGEASWSTSTFDQNANANALRWGTLYNFWFDADAPPAAGKVTIGLFRNGSPASVTAPTLVPMLTMQLVFEDGFESGNVAAWSTAVP